MEIIMMETNKKNSNGRISNVSLKKKKRCKKKMVKRAALLLAAMKFILRKSTTLIYSKCTIILMNKRAMLIWRGHNLLETMISTKRKN